ncbi:MAG: DegQ family serine endoprotease [Deltaproteobacteria bacterium]|nr:DegQ family serine endoprotease [Deltaproteobacteria bacterium]
MTPVTRTRRRARPLACLAAALLLTGAGHASARLNLPDFVTLSKEVRPVVVHISASASATSSSGPFREGDPFADFWRRFFGERFPQNPTPGPSRSVGSGFIVDATGYILTNDHVVEEGQDITVKLADGSEHRARVAGRDPKTDIALVKIDTERNLPVAQLGDSAALEVGEWVLAIGNPFGLEHTVTSGIVSAKGRRIGAGPYDNFIQTDASINPGNSGGPLINLRGEVVGVNTAIFSRGGGNIGIGFAIPINLVKQLLFQLRDEGKVTRGWLGVVIQDVNAEMAEALGMDEARGALVTNVSQGSPAEAGGMQVGDVIVTFDGSPVTASGELPLIVARTPVGKTVDVVIQRDGRPASLRVTVAKLGDDEVAVALEDDNDLGLTVRDAQAPSRRGSPNRRGVVVTAVESGGPADTAGIQAGDVILEIDRKRIDSVQDFRRVVGGLDKGTGILFLVRREDTTLFLALRLPR